MEEAPVISLQNFLVSNSLIGVTIRWVLFYAVGQLVKIFRNPGCKEPHA